MNAKSVKKKIDHKDLSVSVEADEPADYVHESLDQDVRLIVQTENAVMREISKQIIGGGWRQYEATITFVGREILNGRAMKNIGIVVKRSKEVI